MTAAWIAGLRVKLCVVFVVVALLTTGVDVIRQYQQCKHCNERAHVANSLQTTHSVTFSPPQQGGQMQKLHFSQATLSVGTGYAECCLASEPARTAAARSGEVDATTANRHQPAHEAVAYCNRLLSDHCCDAGTQPDVTRRVASQATCPFRAHASAPYASASSILRDRSGWSGATGTRSPSSLRALLVSLTKAAVGAAKPAALGGGDDGGGNVGTSTLAPGCARCACRRGGFTGLCAGPHTHTSAPATAGHTCACAELTKTIRSAVR